MTNALGSMTVAIPDFTKGKRINRALAPVSRYALDAIHKELF
ncbi:hypothetical protein [Paenibacillus sp. MBLB4367]